MNQTITIEYKTRKEYCHCCEQKLPNPKTSEIRQFGISKENIMSWGNWKEVAEFEDDLRECVREFVYETISFFATSSDEKIIIKNSEFNKVEQFVLNGINK